jgi:RNA 2',3'-cyclic 3'-phosphodiesterase
MFVALDLPEPQRSALAAWRDELVEGRDDLRPVAPQALHVTLVFLGWQDADAADAIAAAALIDAEAPILRAAGVRPLPPRDPRLFALDLEDEGDRAAELQAAVSAALEPWYEPEKRPFWPHVTLARVRRGRRRVSPLPDVPPRPAEPFTARELTLYRSTLRPQGAIYEPLARTDLR